MGSNPKLKHSVLFVCSANQCRSPMAEVIFKQVLADYGYRLEEWRVESAGCWAYNGFPPTNAAEMIISEMGLDLSGHTSKGVTQSLLENFNLILCMERNHKTTLRRNFPESREKVYLLSEMVDEEKEIDDPVGLPRQKYQEAFKEIKSYLVDGLKKIKNLSLKNT